MTMIVDAIIKCPVCKGEDFITFRPASEYAFDTIEIFGCTKCGVMVMDPYYLKKGGTPDAKE